MSYMKAKEKYAALGIDTDKAIEKLVQIPLSVLPDVPESFLHLLHVLYHPEMHLFSVHAQ